MLPAGERFVQPLAASVRAGVSLRYLAPAPAVKILGHCAPEHGGPAGASDLVIRVELLKQTFIHHDLYSFHVYILSTYNAA